MIFISINLKFYRPPLKYSLFLTSRSTDEKYPTPDIVINNLSIHFYFESIFLFHFYTTCKPPIQSFFKHRILGQANKFFLKMLLSFCLFKFFLPWDMCWRLCTSWSIPERRRTGGCRYSWRGEAASWGSYSTPPPPRIAVGDRPWIAGSPLCPLVRRSYLANQTIKKLCYFERVPESSCMEILVGILFSNKTIFSLKYSSPQS